MSDARHRRSHRKIDHVVAAFDGEREFLLSRTDGLSDQVRVAQPIDECEHRGGRHACAEELYERTAVALDFAGFRDSSRGVTTRRRAYDSYNRPSVR